MSINDNHNIDYTYIAYWQILKYLTMAILFATVIQPSRERSEIHVQGIYPIFECVFVGFYIIYYICMALAFQDYFYKYLGLMGIAQFVFNFCYFAVIPMRNAAYYSYITSSKESRMVASFLDLLYINMFVINEYLNLSLIEELKHEATSIIFSLSGEENTIQAYNRITLNMISILTNIWLKQRIKKEINSVLLEQNPQEISYLMHEEFYIAQNEVSNGVDKTFWSLMKALSFWKTNNFLILSIIADLFEILKYESNKLLFHFSLPFELLAYQQLLKAEYKNETTLSLLEILMEDNTRKGLIKYIYKTNEGKTELSFLMATAHMRRNSNGELQAILNIYEEYFGNQVQNKIFSDEVQKNISEKVFTISRYENDLVNVYSEAEKEALSYLQNVVVMGYNYSIIGVKILACKAFNQQQISKKLIDYIEELPNIEINPFIIFGNIIEQEDFEYNIFETPSEALVLYTKEYLAENQNDITKQEQIEDIQKELRCFEGNYINIINYDRQQKLICRRYRELFDILLKTEGAGNELEEAQKTDPDISRELFDEQVNLLYCFTCLNYEVFCNYCKIPSSLMKFSEISQQELQKFLQFIIPTEEYLSYENTDTISLFYSSVGKVLCHKALITSFNMCNSISIFDLSPKAIEQCGQLIEALSQKTQYHNYAAAVLTVQMITIFINAIQGECLQPDRNLFSHEQVLAMLLAGSAIGVGNPGYDDNQIILLQHANSIVFNDNCPNQRASFFLGWIVIEMSGLLQNMSHDREERIHEIFNQCLLVTNIHTLALTYRNIESNLNNLKAQVYELKRISDETIQTYVQDIRNIIMILSLYSDCIRKDDTFEMLCQDYAEQYVINMKTETFCLQREYFDYSEIKMYFAYKYEEDIVDYLFLPGTNLLYNYLKYFEIRNKMAINENIFVLVTKLKKAAETRKKYLMVKIGFLGKNEHVLKYQETMK